MAPVFVLSTGRCGSTMVSNILNLHPEVLSISEFFSYVGDYEIFRWPRVSGGWMWRAFSRQSLRVGHMLRDTSYEEFLYPLSEPGARFTLRDVPPILCGTLPHITSDYEALFDELEQVVQSQPRQAPAAHLRYFFEWLCGRFGARVWVERSGSSLMWGEKLLREFPEARVVHVYRDGRDTAISMHGHYLFRLIAATLNRVRGYGINPMGVMRNRSRWGALGAWLTPVVSWLLRPERLRFDKLTVADCAAFWNAQIELADGFLSSLPPERLLNLKFEDMQADPETHVRRLIRFIDSSLEDEEWVRKASAVPRRARSRFSSLDAADQVAVTAACRPGLERLGYLP